MTSDKIMCVNRSCDENRTYQPIPNTHFLPSIHSGGKYPSQSEPNKNRFDFCSPYQISSVRDARNSSVEVSTSDWTKFINLKKHLFPVKLHLLLTLHALDPDVTESIGWDDHGRR